MSSIKQELKERFNWKSKKDCMMSYKGVQEDRQIAWNEVLGMEGKIPGKTVKDKCNKLWSEVNKKSRGGNTNPLSKTHYRLPNGSMVPIPEWSSNSNQWNSQSQSQPQSLDKPRYPFENLSKPYMNYGGGRGLRPVQQYENLSKPYMNYGNGRGLRPVQVANDSQWNSQWNSQSQSQPQVNKYSQEYVKHVRKLINNTKK